MILRRLTRTGSWTVCWGKGRVRGCRVCVLRRGASGGGARLGPEVGTLPQWPQLRASGAW